jgi:Protein of unknown function (DUF2946)
MLRLRLQKIGSILGLLAILMTTLAPTISQAVAADGRVDALLRSHCSAHEGADSTASDEPSSHTTLSHLQACGYCNLFGNAPVLPTAQTGFQITVWVIQHRATARFESLRRVLALTAARPRAPPFSS